MYHHTLFSDNSSVQLRQFETELSNKTRVNPLVDCGAANCATEDHAALCIRLKAAAWSVPECEALVAAVDSVNLSVARTQQTTQTCLPPCLIILYDLFSVALFACTDSPMTTECGVLMAG